MAPKQIADNLISNREKHRATRDNRCWVCGSPDWCLVSEAAVLCPRSPGPESRGYFGEYGYLYLREGCLGTTPVTRRREKPQETDARWRPIAERARLFGADLQPLADALDVRVESLEKLWVGRHSSGWSFPERDAQGHITGIALRYQDGRKGYCAGGKRGLTYSADWRKTAAITGRVFVVEGPSDTAKAMDAGWCAVGRPSNSGGIHYLVPMLGRLGRRTRIIVMGENDMRAHEELPTLVQARHDPECKGCLSCWPGLSGARRVAGELRRRTACRVVVAMPSRGKDIRDLLE